jgi:uncharacterized membrane protein YgdD (TMEM256/DUF423 family)
MMNSDAHRPFLVAAGLLGALGVGASASASHAGHANLAIGGTFLLLHAPALIALSLLPAGRLGRAAGYVLVVGSALFAGDLAMRDLYARPLFPLAAPMGGMGLIVGWMLVTMAGLFGNRRN